MLQSFFHDVVTDAVTWITIGGILVSWSFGVWDIIKFGWNGEGGES